MAVTYRSFVNEVAFFLALLLNPRTASGFHSLKNEFIVSPLLSFPSQINLPSQYALQKKNPVGRPIILGCDGRTERISSFIDNILLPIAKNSEIVSQRYDRLH